MPFGENEESVYGLYFFVVLQIFFSVLFYSSDLVFFYVLFEIFDKVTW